MSWPSVCFLACCSGSARDRSPRLTSTWAATTAAPGREARAGMRLSVNPIDCVAHGVCADLLPNGSRSTSRVIRSSRLPSSPELAEHARRAANYCPVLALRLNPRTFEPPPRDGPAGRSATGVLVPAGCGAGATTTVVTRAARSAASTVAAGAPATPVPTTAPRPDPAPPRPSRPRLLPAALGSSPTAFVPAVSWRGHTAIWIGRSPSGVALLSFDQRLVRAEALLQGTVNAGGIRLALSVPRCSAGERPLVAAFNGGFEKFSTRAGGFESYGRLGHIGQRARPLDRHLHERAHRHRRLERGHAPAAASHHLVRQKLTLLIDTGPQQQASIASRAGARRWVGSATRPLGIGITANRASRVGRGEHLTPSQSSPLRSSTRAWSAQSNWTSTPSGWPAISTVSPRPRTPRAGARGAGPERRARLLPRCLAEISSRSKRDVFRTNWMLRSLSVETPLDACYFYELRATIGGGHSYWPR